MDEEQFAVSQEQRGALPVLRVRGEVDSYTAPRLKEAVLAAFNPDTQSLVIDLSRAGFFDSSGLQVLLSARKRTAERGGNVYVLGADQQALRIFHLVGLETVLQLCSEADLPVS
jgi:anti-sigma B factor antagonist